MTDMAVEMWIKSFANSLKKHVPEYVNTCGHSQEEVEDQVKRMIDECLSVYVGSSGVQEKVPEREMTARYIPANFTPVGRSNI